MNQTSFGKMKTLVQSEDKVVAEYLVFEKEGRKHRHAEFESFAVLSGEGQVYSGEKVFEVKAGDVVTIPPNTSHWMKPKEGQILTGLLWYHTESGFHF